MQLNTQGDCLLFVSEKGMGKRTEMDEFTVQRRGGKGVKCYKITDKTGYVVGVKAVNEENEIMIITTEGIVIRLMVNGISNLGRITSGVRLINMGLENDITVASIAKVKDKSSEEEVIKELEKELEEENSESIGKDEDFEDDLNNMEDIYEDQVESADLGTDDNEIQEADLDEEE
jgi:DNA gyrase subunit A